MLKSGDRLWNGVIVSAEFAETYNALQERMQSFRDEGRPVPEYLLNGSHNLLNGGGGMNHRETHLYTYAVMLTQGDKIRPENLAGVRKKALRFGHTEQECRAVARDPQRYISAGIAT